MAKGSSGSPPSPQELATRIFSWAAIRSIYCTCDLARREVDGTVTVLERLDPMVKVSGQLVSTVAVADVLCEHPLVESAEVVQVPHPDGGRMLVAWVVLAPDASPSAELAADLRSDLHEVLGGLAVPHTVAFAESFPPELSAAERRRALRALATGVSSTTLTVSADQVRAASASDLA